MNTHEMPERHEHEHLEPGENPDGTYNPAAALADLQRRLRLEEAGDQQDISAHSKPKDPSAA